MSKDKHITRPAAPAPDHEKTIASLRSDLSESEAEKASLRKRVEALASEAEGLRALLESATSPAAASRIVRVRAADPNLRGMCLYGHPLTFAGFDLDVAGWTEKQIEALTGDPMVVVEGL